MLGIIRVKAGIARAGLRRRMVRAFGQKDGTMTLGAMVSVADSVRGWEHGHFVMYCRYRPTSRFARLKWDDILAGRGVAFADDDTEYAREGWAEVGRMLERIPNIRIIWSDNRAGDFTDAQREAYRKRTIVYRWASAPDDVLGYLDEAVAFAEEADSGRYI